MNKNHKFNKNNKMIFLIVYKIKTKVCKNNKFMANKMNKINYKIKNKMNSKLIKNKIKNKKNKTKKNLNNKKIDYHQPKRPQVNFHAIKSFDLAHY